MINPIRTALLAGMLLAISAHAAQKVNISFPFRTPAGQLPAGKYLVEMRDTASAKLVQLTNMETRASVLIVPEVPINSIRNDETARLTFSCVSNDCSLSQVWPNNVNGYHIKHKKLSKSEAERLTVVLRTQPAATE